MDSTTPFRLATQIRLGLLRHLGTGIEVPVMMEDKSYAREVIYVCMGCADADLNRLAQEFVAMKNAEREARSPRTKRTVPATVPMLPPTVKPKSAVATEPAETETKSFEMSSQFIQDESPTSGDAAARPRKRWFDPARWLRRGTADS